LCKGTKESRNGKSTQPSGASSGGGGRSGAYSEGAVKSIEGGREGRRKLKEKNGGGPKEINGDEGRACLSHGGRSEKSVPEERDRAEKKIGDNGSKGRQWVVTETEAVERAA